MSLSDNIEIHNDFESGYPIEVIKKKKVKQSIKELKEDKHLYLSNEQQKRIDELVGKELINEVSG